MALCRAVRYIISTKAVRTYLAAFQRRMPYMTIAPTTQNPNSTPMIASRVDPACEPSQINKSSKES